MDRQEIPFVGSSKQHRSPAAANQICRNWFTEIIKDDQGKPASRMLIGVPGKTLLANISATAVRSPGPYMSSSQYTKYWVVIGNTFYEVSNNGNYIPIGQLQTNQGPVCISDNGTHILIVDGTNTGYVYQMSAGGPSGWIPDLAAICGGNFVGGDFVIYISGYFIVIQPGTNILQACAAPFGTSPSTSILWDPTFVFSTALVDAGPLLALGTINEILWAFGDYCTIQFQNTANPTGFPFSLIPGTELNVGTSSRTAIKELNGFLFWPAKTKKGERFIVKTNTLGVYNRISGHELENSIGKYSTISDAYADTYIEEGHMFYKLTYPTGNQTWVWDEDTGDWHERCSYGLGRDRALGHIYFYGRHIVGDSTIGNLYTTSLDVFTEGNQPLVAVRRCQHFKHGRDPLEIPGLIIDAEVGVGLSVVPDVQGYDPQMVLRYSPDGGSTWSEEMTCSMGKIGDTKALIRYPRLGTAEDWVFEIVVSDPVRRNILGAYIDG